MTPINFPVGQVRAARWLSYLECLTVCQFYPNNPFWVVSPAFSTRRSKPIEPVSPNKLMQVLPSQQAFAQARAWVERVKGNPERSRWAFKQDIRKGLTNEQLSQSSRALNTSLQLQRALEWPKSIGLIFPETLPIIGHQIRRVWCVEPFDSFPITTGLWRQYFYNSHVEYVRIA